MLVESVSHYEDDDEDKNLFELTSKSNATAVAGAAGLGLSAF
jgi:hypothetical protein